MSGDYSDLIKSEWKMNNEGKYPAICDKHKVGYRSQCPTCVFEDTFKKDKHIYRKFQPHI